MSLAFSFVTVIAGILLLAALLGVGIVLALLIEKLFDLDSF